jgi:hypothetical protein
MARKKKTTRRAASKSILDPDHQEPSGNYQVFERWWIPPTVENWCKRSPKVRRRVKEELQKELTFLPLIDLFVILVTPEGKPLPVQSHRLLKERLKGWFSGGSKPAEFARCMGVTAAGRGETTPGEQFMIWYRDNDLIYQMLIFVELGATVEDAATLVCARFEGTGHLAKRGISVGYLLRKYSEYPATEYRAWRRETGEFGLLDKTFLAQFPLDLCPKFRDDLRRRGLL